MSSDTCLLCHGPGARRRPHRLGRYAQTCDTCEARRGTHLAAVPPRAVPAPAPLTTRGWRH